MFERAPELRTVVGSPSDARVLSDATSRLIVLSIAFGCACLAVLVLAGWNWNITFLIRVREGLSSMKPIAAIGIGFAALSLGSLALGEPTRARRLIGVGCAGFAVIIGMALGIEWIAGIHPGFESVLFPSRVSQENIPVPGRPSYATVTAIGLLGVALVAIRSRSRIGLATAQSISVLVSMLCALALVGYATGVSALYAFRPYSTMSIYTALSSMALSVGVCLVVPSHGLAALVLGRDAAGHVARRLLPICLGGPVLLGFGVLMLERSGALRDQIGLGMALIGTAVLCSMAVIWVARALRQADALRAEAERRIDRMMSELDHRVKNTMAIVISLCDLTADGSRSLPEFQVAYRGRLTAMARAHEALAAARWKGVDLRFIVETVVVGYAPDRSNSLEIDGKNTLLPPHVALPMAVTLHELATNALKHGAWCAASPTGSVQLSWGWNEARDLTLQWTEKSNVMPDTAPQEGFGLSLIRSMIPHELRGQVELSFAPGGLTCRVRAPIANGRIDAVRGVA